LLLAATAINLKRLSTRPPAAENNGNTQTAAGRANLAILTAAYTRSLPTRQRLLRQAPS
jgi:hypothetical protein